MADYIAVLLARFRSQCWLEFCHHFAPKTRIYNPYGVRQCQISLANGRSGKYQSDISFGDFDGYTRAVDDVSHSIDFNACRRQIHSGVAVVGIGRDNGVRGELFDF